MTADAGQITQTQSFSGTPDFQQALSFNQFDSLGGTLMLQSIKLEVSLAISGGGLKVDNDGANPASGGVEFGAQVQLISSVSLIDSNFQSIIQPGDVKASGGTTVNLSADDGDVEVGGTGNFSYAGSDYGFYNGSNETDSDLGFVNSAVFSQYIGTGTYSITVDADQVANYGALGGVQAQIDPLSAGGTVTVIYTYIPEPATLTLLAVGAVLTGWKRRNRSRA